MTTPKTVITRAEFDKKVDTEFAYLTHVDRMPEAMARKKAAEIVAKDYESTD